MSAQQEAEKLTATWLNNLSVAVFIAGVIAPLSRLAEAMPKPEAVAIFLISLAMWAGAAYLTHVFGRVWLLKRYEE